MRTRTGRDVLLLCIVLGVVGAALAAPPSKGRPLRSDLCGDCHRDIYRMWKSSAHASSLEDPVFIHVYRETRRREGAAVARVCLGCHAPAAELSNDPDLQLKSTWDGVSCEICHSIKAVTTSEGGARMVLDVGVIKRGPIRDAVSTEHGVVYSELHQQSLACAPCHEFANAEGIPIMTTFSEWRASEFAENGVHCQGCHMGKTKAYVVDPIVKRLPAAEVNLHEVPGGHSIVQLHKALDVKLSPRREADALTLDVFVRNKGAGHAVPTGMPGRRVILEVKVKSSDGQSFEERRVYTKAFADASGAPIERDAGFFTRGVALVSDTRVAAGERKEERFRFNVPATATAYVTLALHYEHSPTNDPEHRTYLTFFSEDRTVTASAVRRR